MLNEHFISVSHRECNYIEAMDAARFFFQLGGGGGGGARKFCYNVFKKLGFKTIFLRV
jgi:hypothetical protein